MIKLVEGRDIFVGDFVESLKLAQHELKLYSDPFGKFENS
jgi:hypothetical protein